MLERRKNKKKEKQQKIQKTQLTAYLTTQYNKAKLKILKINS